MKTFSLGFYTHKVNYIMKMCYNKLQFSIFYSTLGTPYSFCFTSLPFLAVGQKIKVKTETEWCYKVIPENLNNLRNEVQIWTKLKFCSGICCPSPYLKIYFDQIIHYSCSTQTTYPHCFFCCIILVSAANDIISFKKKARISE